MPEGKKWLEQCKKVNEMIRKRKKDIWVNCVNNQDGKRPWDVCKRLKVKPTNNEKDVGSKRKR